MVPIYLIEGPVGAGKSTFARRLAPCVAGVHFELDEWFVALFCPERPNQDIDRWYLRHRERLIDFIWTQSLRLAAVDQSPILELGLFQRQARLDFYRRAQADGVSLRVHVLDAPYEVRWQRIAQRNDEGMATASPFVSRAVFEMTSRLWEAPREDEIRQHDIALVNTAPDSN